MAAVSPASYIQAASHSAKSDRMTVGALLEPGSTSDPLAVRGGVKPYGSSVQGSMRVTATGTPDNKSNVAAGSVVIPAQNGGAYVGHNDGSLAVTHNAAHATLDRIDLVVAQVRDAEIGGSDNDFIITAIAGTAAGSPTPPSAPTNSYVLAHVTIRDLASTGGSTVIASGDITDKRQPFAAAGGIIPILAADVAAVTPHLGTAVWKTDTKQLVIWDGSAWVVVAVALGANWDGVLDNALTEAGGLRAEFDESATDITGFSNGFPGGAGSPVVGTTFVAPPSGQVWIEVSGYIECTVNTEAVALGWELRTGGTIGSGTLIQDLVDDYSLIAGHAVTSSPAAAGATRRHLWTGLTPGSTYNIRTKHYATSGGSGNAYHRSIAVVPVL